MKNVVLKIFAAIGAVSVVAVLVGFITFGGTLSKINTLDAQAIPAFKEMFLKILKDGDPAKAMMNEYKVNDDLSNDDVAESLYALAEEYNMRITGDVKMYTKADAKPNEVKHARIFSMCSLHIAKIFLNHSRYFGGMMPCRVILVEYGNGDRYLVTMDLTLAIHGGKPLNPEMLDLATHVYEAMTNIPAKAAQGDF